MNTKSKIIISIMLLIIIILFYVFMQLYTSTVYIGMIDSIVDDTIVVWKLSRNGESIYPNRSFFSVENVCILNSKGHKINVTDLNKKDIILFFAGYNKIIDASTFIPDIKLVKVLDKTF